VKLDHDTPSSVQSVIVAYSEEMQASAPLSPRLLSSPRARPPPLCTLEMQASVPLSPRLLSSTRARPLPLCVHRAQSAAARVCPVTSTPPISPRAGAVHFRAHQKTQGVSREKFLLARSVFLGSPRSPRSPPTPMSPSSVAMRQTSWTPPAKRYPSPAVRFNPVIRTTGESGVFRHYTTHS
jgi:hypothetical protein